MTALMRRLDRSLIAVLGDERQSWLNGQITNDVATLEAGGSVYALAVDVKGKILADLWVYARPEALLLAVPSAEREALLAHFDRYIIMEDVELEPVDNRVLLSAQGGGSDELGVEESYPADRLGIGGIDALVSASEVQSTLEDWAARGFHEDRGAWEQRRIEAGRPRFGLDFGPSNYPQEAGLTTSAVSFEKGCYLGQEVVCMLESRGHARRRLVRLTGPTGEVGDALCIEEKPVGNLTSVGRPGPDGQVQALGYVKRAHAEVGRPIGAFVVRAVVGVSSPGQSTGRDL